MSKENRTLLDIIRLGLNVVFFLCYRMETEGIDKIPKKGPAIILEKHVRKRDSPEIGTRLKNIIGRYAVFPMKMEGLPRKFLEALKASPTPRLEDLLRGRPKGKKERRVYVRKIAYKMRKHYGGFFEKKELVVVYPEGTRTPEGVRPVTTKLIRRLISYGKEYDPNIPVFVVATKHYPGRFRPRKRITCIQLTEEEKHSEDVGAIVTEYMSKLSGLPIVRK